MEEKMWATTGAIKKTMLGVTISTRRAIARN